MTDEQRIQLRQRRDLGEIIDASLKIYSQNFAVLFSLAALVIPLSIAAGIFQEALGDETGLAVASLINVAQAAVSVLAGSAVIVAVSDLDEGKVPEFGRSFDTAFAKFGTLIMVVLRATFHILLFAITIVGIPWAIQRSIRWVFIQQAVLIEGARWDEALSKSADVVIGSWWRTFGCWLVIAIAPTFVAGIAGLAFVFTPIVVASITSALFEALILPFIAIGSTLLYFDLKLKKEDSLPAPPTPAEEELS